MRQVLLGHILESTYCFLWTNELPCCHELCYFEVAAEFWFAPGREPEKQWLLKKKIIFLGFTLSHIKTGCMVPTSEQGCGN